MTSTFPTVDATTADALVDQGAVLLDVREDDEWEAGRAPAAVHAPLGGVTADRLPTGVEPGAVVVTLCRSGKRSAKAAERLSAQGVDVRDLDGGMQAWVAAGLPVVRDGGAPGTVA